MRLLLVEDEPDLAEVLTAFLQKNNYTVEAVGDGLTALDYIDNDEYDAIILDIMLPKLDGLSVLSKLRENGSDVPVMLLTAKGEKDDRVKGFNTGADDYLPKPFAPDELLARLRAILRRGGEYKPTIMEYGDLKLNCSTGELMRGDSKEQLSGREFQIMELFMRSPKVVFSADRIMERVWGYDSDAEINVVWVHISNIRKKLKALNSRVSVKVNRGMGYLLSVDGDDKQA